MSRRKPLCLRLHCLWWMCVVLLGALPARGLEIQHVRWGFDGKAVPGRFNILSVLVANHSPAPFDGTVHLYKSRGLEERVGALYAAPCYLSPLNVRWIQFHVYIDNAHDEWRLQWGRSPNDRLKLDPPGWGQPAQVLLAESESPVSQTSGFKLFPEELFPSTVAATAGLESVLLDHVPRWEPARRQAFVSWLRAGGTVHLADGPDGRRPTFADELAVLNIEAGERMRVGAGMVIRHPAAARSLRPADLLPSAPPTPSTNSPQAETQELSYQEQTAISQMSDAFFRSLARLSRPRHDWGAIYVLALCYVGIVGPGTILMRRHIRDYRLLLAALLGCVVAFGLVFHWLGRAGQSGASVVHTLSYARAIGDDTYNVMQWVNVFATRGDVYTITHAAPHNLYATGQDYESVKGTIVSGKDGFFSVDIPLFSRRGLLHQAEMTAAAVQPEIVRWDGDETLKNLSLTVRHEITNDFVDGWVVHGGRVFRMELKEGLLQNRHSEPDSIKSFMANALPSGFGFMYGYDSDEPDVKAGFQSMAAPLIAWSLRIFKSADEQKDWEPAPDGRTHLFLLARSPESLSIASGELGREIGYVLYHLDLFPDGL